MIRILTALRPSALTRRLRREEGATAVEYGLMVALIALVIIGTVTALGTSLSGKFGQVQAGVAGAGNPPAQSSN